MAAAHTPASDADLDRRARNILIVVALVVSVLVLGVCGGVGAHLLSSQGSATCSGREMGPQDTCITSTNGHESARLSYQEKQAADASSTHLLGWVSLGCAAVGLWGILYVLWKIRAGRRRRTRSLAPPTS